MHDEAVEMASRSGWTNTSGATLKTYSATEIDTPELCDLNCADLGPWYQVRDGVWGVEHPERRFAQGVSVAVNLVCVGARNPGAPGC